MDAPVKPEHDVGARLRDRMRSGFVRRGWRKRPQKRKRPSAGSERPKSREETPKKGSSDAKRRYEKEFRLRSGLPQRTILQVRSAYIAYHPPLPRTRQGHKGIGGGGFKPPRPRRRTPLRGLLPFGGGRPDPTILENAWLRPEAGPELVDPDRSEEPCSGSSRPGRAVGATIPAPGSVQFETKARENLPRPARKPSS